MPLVGPLVAGKLPISAGGLAPTGALSPPAGGAAPRVAGSSGVLPFTMQAQSQDNWCWSATATSVSAFYNSGSAWTQCLLANAILPVGPGTNCCGVDGPTPVCDVPWYLEKALAKTANLLDVIAGELDFSDVADLIDGGTPLAVRIGWTGGGGHFVVVRGWKKTTSGHEFLDVADPYAGAAVIPYDDFRTCYRTSGTWTHSYRTIA